MILAIEEVILFRYRNGETRIKECTRVSHLVYVVGSGASRSAIQEYNYPGLSCNCIRGGIRGILKTLSAKGYVCEQVNLSLTACDHASDISFNSLSWSKWTQNWKNMHSI